MDVILDAIVAILDAIASFFGAAYSFFLSSIFDDSMYRQGFLRGIMITVFVGAIGTWIKKRIQWAQAKIAAFFKPSTQPATKPGPSGFNVATGCGQGAFVLGCGFILAIIILVALVIFPLLY